MRTVFIIFITLAAASAFAGSKFIHSYENDFKTFEIEIDKSAFCKSKLKKGGLEEECLHQLIIFERATKVCEKALNFKSCMTLNGNLWERKTDDLFSFEDSYAYNTKTKVDPLKIHKYLLEEAPKFILQCADANKKVNACPEQ